MAIRLLTTHEKLLRRDEYVGFIGTQWNAPYSAPASDVPSFWRVASAEPIPYSRRVGANDGIEIATAAARNVDPNTVFGLEPEQDSTLYETRWGIPPHMLFYILWPQGQIRGSLEEAGFDPTPADAALRFLGSWSSRLSPLTDPRLEIMLVRGHMPLFQYRSDTGQRYFKVVFSVIVNKLSIQQVKDPALQAALLRRDKPWKPIYHPSVLGIVAA